MSRIVVITGASSGIGSELKKLFEGMGDTVLTISRSEGTENHYMADVSHDIKMRQVFNDIKEKYGKVDILINNAGVGMSGITELLPLEDINKLVDVNLYGVLNCVRSALPIMHEGAKIINMSSAMALFPVPFRSIYGAVKSAVLNLSFSLKMELKPLGIDVCAMCPGDVKTNFTNNRLKHFETNERYGARVKTATEKNDSREEKRMPSEKCGQKIFKAINKKKLKPFYIIGGKYKFIYFLTRITPKSWLLNITASMMNGQYEAKGKKQINVQRINRENIKQENIAKTESMDSQEKDESLMTKKVMDKPQMKSEQKPSDEKPKSLLSKGDNPGGDKKELSSLLKRLEDKRNK